VPGLILVPLNAFSYFAVAYASIVVAVCPERHDMSGYFIHRDNAASRLAAIATAIFSAAAAASASVQGRAAGCTVFRRGRRSGTTSSRERLHDQACQRACHTHSAGPRARTHVSRHTGIQPT